MHAFGPALRKVGTLGQVFSPRTISQLICDLAEYRFRNLHRPHRPQNLTQDFWESIHRGRRLRDFRPCQALGNPIGPPFIFYRCLICPHRGRPPTCAREGIDTILSRQDFKRSLSAMMTKQSSSKSICSNGAKKASKPRSLTSFQRGCYHAPLPISVSVHKTQRTSRTGTKSPMNSTVTRPTVAISDSSRSCMLDTLRGMVI
ncbi:hypothetical protein C8J56DRAFT_290433 [Mycena floridula]|nr:hypothetical protein C8J56DRAFT_290433 [Mycena floridula]